MNRRRSRRTEPPSRVARTTGKREANKIDKLNRIKRAARELFMTIGYDEATTRKIATKAGVALGTVRGAAAVSVAWMAQAAVALALGLLAPPEHAARSAAKTNRYAQRFIEPDYTTKTPGLSENESRVSSQRYR